MKKLSVVIWFGIVALGGWAAEAEKPGSGLEIRAAEDQPSPGLTEMAVPGQDRKIYVGAEALLTHADLQSAASTTRKEDGKPQIEIVFTAPGKAKFAKVTAASIMKPLAILVDGKLLSAPIVRQEIVDGRAVITGAFSQKEAQRIVKALQKGK